MVINSRLLFDTGIHYVRNVDFPRGEGEQPNHGARVVCIERCHLKEVGDDIQGLREWRLH